MKMKYRGIHTTDDPTNAIRNDIWRESPNLIPMGMPPLSSMSGIMEIRTTASHLILNEIKSAKLVTNPTNLLTLDFTTGRVSIANGICFWYNDLCV
jgi:hypothetical protein